MPFPVKLIKMPLVYLKLAKSQIRSNSFQNNIFNVFTSNPSHLEIFVKFDLKLTLRGPRNSNFDLIVKTGWD